MKVSDLILGPVIALFGVLVMVAATLQPRPIFGSGYGGGFFPGFIGTGLLLAGLMLAWTGWRSRDTGPLLVMGAWARSPVHLANAATVIAALIVYILASGFLGFLITGAMVTFATLWQFTRQPVMSLAVTIVAVIVVKYIFQDLLLVPLPLGVLSPFAGILSWR
ncbi:hypothetical protein EMQ25_16865 [Arsenicitalea aurantiaca]|uniref:DUF1468 domain-containing protein n=1 Tax=Arsenicitalea aurantiaca TaxID=1783274 RepID=A0A433X2E3_9HYPH|nr:tripartite tricarboxylate transporter TctB family protein [Arsenicitalea aurantiaca]RUT28258.1 hypothetical protein EMQ25_16865 [Arsenicitalea aurantiaca]